MVKEEALTRRELSYLRSETQRLCQRYIDEIVLPYALCPWAEMALRNDRVQTHVIMSEFEGKRGIAQAAEQLHQVLSEEINVRCELALIVFPRTNFSRLEMDELLRATRQIQRPTGEAAPVSPQERYSPIEKDSFALAAFHPDAKVDDETPERLIPFLRRTPDPMIQAVRISTLSKIDPDRGSGTAFFDVENIDLTTLNQLNIPCAPNESLRLQVARANLKTCKRAGFRELEEIYSSIFEDHTASRAKKNTPSEQ